MDYCLVKSILYCFKTRRNHYDYLTNFSLYILLRQIIAKHIPVYNNYYVFNNYLHGLLLLECNPSFSIVNFWFKIYYSLTESNVHLAFLDITIMMTKNIDHIHRHHNYQQLLKTFYYKDSFQFNFLHNRNLDQLNRYFLFQNVSICCILVIIF